MGHKLSCAKDSEARLALPKLQPDDIKSFYDAIISKPVFNDRFKNVPLLKVLSMANEVLFFLQDIRRGRSVTSFQEILDLHSLMYISEAEIDAFFQIFIEHFQKQAEYYWDSFEPGIVHIKNTILDREKLKLFRFYKEIKRNPILHKHFKTTSPRCLCKMMDDIFRLLESRILSEDELERI